MAKTGRPKKQIDKGEFEKLCALQCTYLEFCGYFDVTDKTLESWCRETYGSSFSDVFALKRGTGKISLRRKQFQLSETEPSMAIWLGKQWLGQSNDPVLSDDENRRLYPGLPAKLLGSEWVDVNRMIDDREFSEFDFKGGRGSLKSSFCGIKVIDLIMTNQDFCGLVIRQLKDNLADSVYSQIVWAIDVLGLTEQFYCTKSPMQIRRRVTNQIIYFRGADDPGKIKSIRPPHGKHIGVVWVEEADQLNGAEDLRNILQSAFRGGDGGLLFRSYNTPRSRQHYINLEALQPNPNRYIHHSHFRNAPRKWLGDKFYQIADHLKATNPTAYEYEYDGKAIGIGSNVFDNLEIRRITDAETQNFDRHYYGNDWGWFPDPNHFAGMHYQANTRTLYIFEEFRCWKTTNIAYAELLKKFKGVKITADSGGEGKKSIADFSSYGFNMYPAVKGPGSVEYGMKWLQSLSKIVIDPVRCPHTAEEFQTYEYEQTKSGEVISSFPDARNHAIDATRYAMEEVWRRKGQ